MGGYVFDVVCCWYCWVSSIQQDEIVDLLKVMKFFVVDFYFGICEVVIFVIKERLVGDLLFVIFILVEWIRLVDENVCCYVVEVLCLIGVWIKKIVVF